MLTLLQNKLPTTSMRLSQMAFIFALLGCSHTIVGTKMKKFIWQASESGPQHYPMKIIAGSLSAANGDSRYVPNGVRLHNGWGQGRSSHVVGDDLQSLPNRLSILFFSYSENQFYRGDFKLPYDNILALFQAGHYSPNEGGDITYDEITVGVAPGGAVSVWLVSIDRTVEVFFGYADKEEGDWKWINDNPKITRKEYVCSGIQHALEAERLSPEAIAAINKNGIPFGLWERYHQSRYHWQPLFTNMPLLDTRIQSIKFFNGERDYINYPIEKNKEEQTRAVPSELVFIWDRPKRKPLMVELYFNEDEIFTVFKKLGASNEPLQLEMRLDWVDNDNKFSIWLRNKKESIEIKKTKIETYGIPDRDS